VGDDQAATGAQGVAQPGHAPVGVFLVADEVKQQRHAERYRLGEVDDPPQFGVPEDAAGVSQVTGDEDHAGQAVKVSAATREHERVVVNVGDPRVRVMLPCELVHIAPGRQARADVNELADAGLSGEEPDRVLEELPVLQGGQRDIGRGPEHQPGRFPVGVGVLVPAEVVIPHARDVRDCLVNARQPSLVSHLVLLVSGHPGEARLPGHPLRGSAAGPSISR
jgi:hypothetical protein